MSNQMWQIAACVGYARKWNKQFVLPKWEYARFFAGTFNEATGIPPMSTYQEKSFHYSDIPKYKRVDLYGYFQSIKYWEHCQKEIKMMFEPNLAIRQHLIKSPIDKGVCAIHVRRTDYLQLKEYHASQPMSYYKDAMKSMNATAYIVFSDDIAWCKEQKEFEGCHFVQSGNDILDWFMMRDCTHFIIANSSFSFWASYLAKSEGRRIIAPIKERWFGHKYNDKNLDDLYLKNWELL